MSDNVIPIDSAAWYVEPIPFDVIGTCGAVAEVQHNPTDTEGDLGVDYGFDCGNAPTIRVGDYHLDRRQADQLLSLLIDAVSSYDYCFGSVAG